MFLSLQKLKQMLFVNTATYSYHLSILQHIPTIFSSRSANSYPNPESQPVISTDFPFSDTCNANHIASPTNEYHLDTHYCQEMNYTTQIQLTNFIVTQNM
jgi:hypothetical protein